MQSTDVARSLRSATFAAMVGVTGLIAAGALTGTTARLGLDDRVAYALFMGSGMVLCSLGRLGQGARYGWTHPLHLAGYGLGTLALVGSVLVLLTGVADLRLATGMLGAVMIIKLAIGRLYPR